MEIGSFETPLLDKSESRVNNIKLAARKLDGYKLNRKEFSFNRVVEREQWKKGYKVAPIIILSRRTERLRRYRGGMPAVSTLYSAVNEAV